ncbi:MAG: helix-turn-helix domain-containing protein [Pseudomonadota bacterium]
MFNIVVVEFETSLASSVAITHDVLDTANNICAASKRKPLFNVSGFRCGPRTRNAAVDGADLVIVPGLGISSEKQLVEKLESSSCRRAGELLDRAFESGAAVAASCASTFLLADTGILENRRATTTWWLAAAFRRRYPGIELTTDKIVVADWPVATAGAAMAQMDLMLAIVSKFGRQSLSEDCARYLLLDERRSQAPFISISYLAGQDSKISKAESWIRKHIADDFSVPEIAAVVALTPRTFARRLATTCGLSPVRFVQRIRIETAKTLLETTRQSVDEVARQVGYAEPSTLRRLLRRETNRSPGSFRLAN